MVVAEDLTPLLGAKAIQQMKLIEVREENFERIATTRETSESPLQTGSRPTAKEIVKQYSDVFDGELGTLEGQQKLTVDPTVPPNIAPPRRVPFALKPKLKAELERLTDLKVIMPVEEPTDWVSNLVIATKSSGDVRLCLDPKPLNTALKRERYPLPVIEDVLPDLAKAKLFTKVDARNGYWHVQLDEESSKLTTFDTPYGRFCWRRLPFGVNVASEIFEKKLHQALDRLDGVLTVRDDMVIYGVGETEEEAREDHNRKLQLFLQRCREKGVKLNKSKLNLECKEISYLGHMITPQGLKPDPEKVKAVLNMPKPTDVKGVRRFCGFVNYLARFMPRLSEVIEPIQQLAKKDVDWRWQHEHDAAFEKIQIMATTAPVLKYFEPEAEVTVQCDASEKGLGAALMQKGQPIAYASRALTDAETRYAQIEKEMLSVVFALHKFDQYVYGRHVTVENDHKPLATIVKKPLRNAPKRLQGMLLKVQKYDVDIVYKPGPEMYLADTLSRAFLSSTENAEGEFERINAVKYLPVTDERLEELKKHTQEDEVLQQLRQTIQTGWPEEKRDLPPALEPYFSYRDELSVFDGLVFKGERLIVPKQMRQKMKERLHSSHIGINGCLRRARECLFWPSMTAEIKQYISQCETCSKFGDKQARESLMSHEVTERPWEKVGTDLFLFNEKDYLIVVDYFSNFWEIDVLTDTTAETVIRCLKRYFARYGIPDAVISDNGPQYACDKFKKFAKDWGFEHRTSSPGHQQANGKAEAAVKDAKKLLRKAKDTQEDIYLAILAQRNTPTELMGSSPAQRLLGRRCKTQLPITKGLLKPQTVPPELVQKQRKKKQQIQSNSYNRGTRDLDPLEEGDVVRMRPFRLGQKSWEKGNVVKRHDERSYEIETELGSYRRNRVDLRLCQPQQQPAESIQTDSEQPPAAPEPTAATTPSPEPTASNERPTATPVPQRPKRTTREPAYLKDYEH